MPFTTYIAPKLRNPAYHANKNLPDNVIRQMRREIVDMRRDLLRKQERLAKSPRWTSDERLKAEIDSYKTRKMTTNEQVQKAYWRLYSLELSNYTSIQGRERREKMQIETLHHSGFTFITKANYRDFTNFMDWAQNKYTNQAISSDEEVKFFEDQTQKGKVKSNEELQRVFEDWIKHKS